MAGVGVEEGSWWEIIELCVILDVVEESTEVVVIDDVLIEVVTDCVEIIDFA